MSVFSKGLILAVFILTVSQTEACVWDSSIDKTFLEMSSIPVCFLPPSSQVSASSLEHYMSARTTVISAIRNIQSSTNLQFQGFSVCDESNSNQNMIKIELDNTGTPHGYADLDDGFPKRAPNLQLNHMASGSNEVARNPSNLKFTTQHELLHLLGIQHDLRVRSQRDYDKFMSSNPSMENRTRSFDALSVMNLTNEDLRRLDNNETMREVDSLSRADSQCINSIKSGVSSSASPEGAESATESGLRLE